MDEVAWSLLELLIVARNKKVGPKKLKITSKLGKTIVKTIVTRSKLNKYNPGISLAQLNSS